MIEAMMAGFTDFFTPVVILVTFAGIIIGLIFGLMPGISILPAMAVLLPLTYGVDSTIALSLLVAVQAVGFTGGSVTAILINIPGTGSNAATLLDGFPMTKKGQGGRAVGAALCASGLGGLFGGLVLALLIPVAYSVALLFGSGETALMGLLGLTFIAVLSGGSVIKGLIAGLVGIMISFIGVHGVTGVVRFTFGNLYLYDGLDMVAVLLGMFALPEIFELIFKRGGTIAEVDRSVLKQTGWAQVYEGIKDVFRHWMLFIRCSVLGVIIGIIPGVGGAVAQWVAYGHAKQTSKHPELYGTGIIEGVIAPEAANNSKEGGSIVPTITFGIPGSIAMVLLLAAFLIHGIQPGPAMLSEHLDLTWTITICLIFSNLVGAALLLPFVSSLARVAFVRGRVLIPVILVVAAFGAFASKLEYWDIVLAFIFGVLGYIMMKTGYERVALILGFILGGMVERYLTISISALGAAFLLRPTAMILVICIILMLFYTPVKNMLQKRRSRT